MRIHKEEILSGTGKFESGRVGLQVHSFEFGQRILQIELSGYDTDGQKGLYIPNSPEMNALREMFTGMGNSARTSITMNNSATYQITAD